jgi:trehalose 6-phosphate phosphatase
LIAQAPTMQHLFQLDGEAALAALLCRRALLAFDFDGTLAPIVARPGDARPSQAVSLRLKALSSQLPTAIVTGRSVADVRERLGFEPHYIVGNHGAEDPLDPGAAARHSQRLGPLRRLLELRCAELAGVGVAVEDKGASLALHYRLSRDRERAMALITALLSPQDAALNVFGGKMVVNVAPRDAPDKASAVRALLAHSGADCALYAGDDLNDEPVFAAAPPDWLTIRVGRVERHSRARYFLASPNEIAMLLERMLALLPAARPG